jgi:mRNA interferase MazF
VVIAQGEIWWADLPEPVGSEPGFRRPVLVVQSDALNRSALNTAVCVALTGNLALASLPGNLLLPARLTGLPRDSVVNGSQILSVDRSLLTDRVGLLPRPTVELVLSCIDVILGRT